MCLIVFRSSLAPTYRSQAHSVEQIKNIMRSDLQGPDHICLGDVVRLNVESQSRKKASDDL